MLDSFLSLELFNICIMMLFALNLYREKTTWRLIWMCTDSVTLLEKDLKALLKD